MKIKHKNFLFTILAILFASGLSLYGCSEASTTTDTDTTKQDEPTYSKKNDEGYTVWHIGNNDLENDVVLNLSDLTEKQWDTSGLSPNPACYWLDALTKDDSLLSSFISDKLLTINSKDVRSGDPKLGELKRYLLSKYNDHAFYFAGPKSGTDAETVYIGQTPCSSPDILEKRLEQAKAEKWEIAEKVTDNVYRFKEGKWYVTTGGIQNETDDVWYAYLNDGMLTVWTAKPSYIRSRVWKH